MEGSGRDEISGTVPTFSRRGCGKQRNTPVRVLGQDSTGKPLEYKSVALVLSSLVLKAEFETIITRSRHVSLSCNVRRRIPCVIYATGIVHRVFRKGLSILCYRHSAQGVQERTEYFIFSHCVSVRNRV